MKEKNNIDICGVLVQVLKNQTKQVENTLNAMAGVEVHGLSEDSCFYCVGLSAFRATLGISNDLFTKAVFIKFSSRSNQ